MKVSDNIFQHKTGEERTGIRQLCPLLGNAIGPVNLCQLMYASILDKMEQTKSFPDESQPAR